MSCNRFRDEMGDVAAGATASGDLRQHLAGCEACRARLESQRVLITRIDGELRSALSLDPTPGLLLRARRRAEERSFATRMNHWRWLVPAAVALGVLVLGVSLGRDSGRPPAPDRATVAEARRPAPAGTAAAGRGEPEPPSPARPAPAAEPALRTARAVVARPARPAGPEVLVPRNEAEVLLSFVRSVGTRPWDPRSLLAAGLEPEAAPVPDIRVGAVEIPPLAVEPLPENDAHLSRSDS
jgi:hypothetical protein